MIPGMALRKGLALSILWADVPEETRGGVLAWARQDPIGEPERGEGVLAVGRYAAVSGAPPFIEVYELADEAAATTAACAGRQARTGRALAGAGATITRGVYAQIFPSGVDERSAVHGLPPALQIGRIGIPPLHDEEFNEWYNGEYLVGYLKVPGVYGARRYRNRTEGLPYLTVYELADDQVSRQPEWDRVRAQSVWRRRIERLWSHAPGSPGIYRRLASG